MWRLSLILLLFCAVACSSTPDVPLEPDPFADAEPVDGGLYADLPAEPASSGTWGVWHALDEEWERSVAGWSFTTRVVGRWAQRDWNRIFNAKE